MKILQAILSFLQGKKGAIASIIGIINVWLYAKGLIDLVTATAIGGVATVLFGSASYVTGKILSPTPAPCNPDEKQLGQ